MPKEFTEVIHSDFLIHWTGIDIDKKEEESRKAGKTPPIVPENSIAAYIQRLKDILKFGFWMTIRDKPETIDVNGNEFTKPPVARTCFTELKLSEVRKHAEKYGRLGIGLKRYYVFDRLGGPMHYMQPDTHNLLFPPYSSYVSAGELEVLSFYKHMCSRRPLTYDFYAESEWRIIFSESIKGKMGINCPDRLSRFIDPTVADNEEVIRYYRRIEGNKPKYLLPLDGWLAIIIYPSPEVKNRARVDDEVNQLIQCVKDTETVTGCPKYEYKMWPIEVNLDACSHF